MSRDTRHLGVRIERDAQSVYDFAGNPANLPSWAAGLSGSIEQVGGRWLAESPMGPVEVAFAPRNEYRVLDHRVTLTDGQIFDNPMRVVPDGTTACDVVFTLRRADGMSDEEYDADAAAIEADLATLKRLLEAGEESSAG